ncbi:unnamed protein product [Trichogramma brassicae]|uniref:Uncharacterized protein n=1 Tax=Trichogramma brassicae TaxID=86971 RepID=A0A6H5ISN5_9HYME|nr:unnamed protein product [Trichogramma brassicae]
MSLKLVLLCLAALAALAHSQSHDLVIGERQYNDILVYSENIALQASVVGQKVVHEQTFSAINNHVITQVVAKDSANDGTGATVTVTGGGPGHDSITLRFKSQRFRGVYFTVQVFAKPKSVDPRARLRPAAGRSRRCAPGRRHQSDLGHEAPRRRSRVRRRRQRARPTRPDSERHEALQRAQTQPDHHPGASPRSRGKRQGRLRFGRQGRPRPEKRHPLPLEPEESAAQLHSAGLRLAVLLDRLKVPNESLERNVVRRWRWCVAASRAAAAANGINKRRVAFKEKYATMKRKATRGRNYSRAPRVYTVNTRTTSTHHSGRKIRSSSGSSHRRCRCRCCALCYTVCAPVCITIYAAVSARAPRLGGARSGSRRDLLIRSPPPDERTVHQPPRTYRCSCSSSSVFAAALT